MRAELYRNLGRRKAGLKHQWTIRPKHKTVIGYTDSAILTSAAPILDRGQLKVSHKLGVRKVFAWFSGDWQPTRRSDSPIVRKNGKPTNHYIYDQHSTAIPCMAREVSVRRYTGEFYYKDTDRLIDTTKKYTVYLTNSYKCFITEEK